MQGTNLFVRRKRERCCFVYHHCIEISYLQVTEKRSLFSSVQNKLYSSSLSGVHTRQLWRREHKRMGAIMTQKCFSLQNNYRKDSQISRTRR